MGVSTDGRICYGILFEEGHPFPWGEHDDDPEAWWTVARGWKPEKEIYNEEGKLLPGITNDDTRAYYDSKYAFRRKNPCPISMVNVCSGDYPIYIMVMNDTFYLSASRGYPEAFDPAKLVVSDEQRGALLEFCRQHGIETGDAEPKWYLSSYWG